MANTTRMKMRRAVVLLAIRSHSDSGRATSPICAASPGLTSNSGRTGGGAARKVGTSAMRRHLVLLDTLGEQHGVDALVQRLELGPALRRVVEIAGVELGLHLAGMRTQDKDTRPYDDRLFDRMRDKEHGEARVFPELQQ